MTNIKLFFLLLLFSTNAFAVCSSPISRTNNTANQVLTSTKYNLDLNTVYSKVNSLPGDCIVDASITTDKIADQAVTSAKLAAGLLAQFIPVGTILPYAGAVAPAGFLVCNGQAVSRTTYADLFAVTSTVFGSGNGSSTFNVPDFRGRFLRMVDGGAGRDPDAASRTAMATGGAVADNIGSVQNDELKTHTHGFSQWQPSINTGGGWSVNDDAYRANETTTATGGNETRPKNANVNYIIKY